MQHCGTNKVSTLIELISSHMVTEELNLDWFIRISAEVIDEDKQFRLRKFRQILSQEFELERSGKFMKRVKQLEAQNRVMIKEKNAVIKNNGYLWVTINPQPQVLLKDFIVFIKKICKKTCFTAYQGVFEQRGTVANNDIGVGFHAHILFRRALTYKPAKCADNIRNSCTKIVGNIRNNHQLNISIIGPDFAKDKLAYMVEKTDEGKDLKQAGDVIWRTANVLLEGYAEGELGIRAKPEAQPASVTYL